MTFRYPNDTQHIAVIGKNGTGKTLAAMNLLSRRPFEDRPELIIDFKRDEHIAQLEAEEIPVGSIPEKSGLYVVRPDVSAKKLLVPTMEKAYRRENIGVFIDEAFVLSQDKDAEGMLENLLTQGRSKHIPLIILIQRPLWVSRFVFTECSFFQLFHLQDKRDATTLQAVLPESAFDRLPPFHSSYYDVGRDQLDFLSPVPQEDEIVSRINKRIRAMRKRNGPRYL